MHLKQTASHPGSLTLRWLIPFVGLPALLVLPSLLAADPAGVEPTPIRLSDNMNGFYAATSSLFFEDRNADIPPEDVLSGLYDPQFRPMAEDSPGFGFTNSVWWMHIRTQNPSAGTLEWYLEFAYPMLDQIDLYRRAENGWERLRMGDRHPFYSRKIHYRNFLFRLDEKPQAESDYYIRVQTTSSMNLPVQVWSPDQLMNKLDGEKTLLGGYAAVMLSMVLYNFFLFISIRDRSYLYYVLFVLSFLLFAFTLNGLSFQYLWPNWIWWGNNSLPFFIGFSSIWGLLFGRKYLRLMEDLPLAYKIFTALIGISIVSSFVSLALAYRVAIRITTALALLSAALCMITGVIQMSRRFRPAYYYIFAWITLLLGMILFSLKSFGLLPANFLTNWSMQIGSALEVILLSIGLADRINILQNEKDRAQQEIMESRQRMLDSFARFVPREFLLHLERADIMDVDRGDAIRKRLTVLFSDIRNFTSLSESMEPEETFRFLNSYLDRMGAAVDLNGGFIDKYIGDAIMALYAESPDGALDSAVSMRSLLREYNRERQREGFLPIEMGVGLHAGELMLGTLGSSRRLDTTVIGDTVNVAARLESLTKVFRVPILISDSIYDNLKYPDRYQLREVDLIRLRGRKNPLRVYEVFNDDSEETQEVKLETMNEFYESLKMYRHGSFQVAHESFTYLHERFPNDPIFDLYMRRCEKLIEEPPGPAWKGISRMR